jgi:tetratricopeptide (TPR) repeat protein
LQLFEFYPQSSVREQALKNAATCYENATSWIAAKNTYYRYVESYPDNHFEILEFTYKTGEMAFKANQPEDAKLYFEETVRTYNRLQLAGESLDNYFVAQAQFMIGEILYGDYIKLGLLPPFEKNLKIKIDSFIKVVKAYTESIKYQIGDWSTASSHRIGMCFEEFVRAFLEAPVPDNLDEALDTYTKNIEQAEANGIDNSWVADSRARVLVLTQELQFGGQAHMSTIEGS